MGLHVSASLTGQLTSSVAHSGVYAVFGLMALDALLPAAGELVMLYAGALAAGVVAGHPALFGAHLHRGLEVYVVLALAGSLGYFLGALVGWAIGARGGRPLLERRGRWVHVSPATLGRAEAWFARYGSRAVFLGRLTPVVRSFISITAGALGSPLSTYVPLTMAGSLIWCFGFAGVGWALGHSWEQVHHAFRLADYAVVAVAAAVLVAAVARRRRARVRSSR